MNTSTTFFCFVKPMFFWKSLLNLAGSRKSPRVPNIGWGICDSSETQIIARIVAILFKIC